MPKSAPQNSITKFLLTEEVSVTLLVTYMQLASVTSEFHTWSMGQCNNAVLVAIGRCTMGARGLLARATLVNRSLCIDL